MVPGSGVAEAATIPPPDVMKVWEAVGPLTFISMVASVEDWPTESAIQVDASA